MSILNSISGIFSGGGKKMTDKFSLSGFTANINKTGIANPAYFMVMITPPAKLNAKMKGIGGTLPLRITQAVMPTRNILTHDQKYYGPMRNIPYGFTNAPITFTILLSEDYREREFFLQWQDLMVGNSRTGGQTNGQADGAGGTNHGKFDVGYYNDAVGLSVDLYAYGTSPAMQGGSGKIGQGVFSQLQEVARAVGFDPSTITSPFGLNIFGGQKERQISHAMHVKLIEPFPISVADVNMSWADDAGAMLQVTMQYRYAQELQTSFPAPSETSSLANMIRGGIQAFNRFAPVFSLVKGQGLGGAVRGALGQVGNGAKNAGVAQKSVLPF